MCITYTTTCITHHYRHFTDLAVQFYKLVDFLHRECEQLEINGTLLCLHTLSKGLTDAYHHLNTDLCELFNKYHISQITIDEYLEQCSCLIHSHHFMLDELPNE